MRRNGFTLVEMLITLALIAVLMTLAWQQWDVQVRKVAIEAQTRKLLTDLLKARADALYQRRPCSVVVRGDGLQYSVYSSVATDSSVAALSVVDLKYQLVTSGATPIGFDERGLLMNDAANAGACICVSAGNNSSSVDSLVLSNARIQIGKWTVSGGSASDCTADKITR